MARAARGQLAAGVKARLQCDDVVAAVVADAAAAALAV